MTKDCSHDRRVCMFVSQEQVHRDHLRSPTITASTPWSIWVTLIKLVVGSLPVSCDWLDISVQSL